MSTDDYKGKALLGKIIAGAWSNDDFAARLRKEPLKVFSEYGLHPPQNLKIIIHFDSQTMCHVIADPGWENKFGSDAIRNMTEEPRAALRAVGYNVRDDIEYKVLFNTMGQMNIVIRRKPSYYECSIEYLK